MKAKTDTSTTRANETPEPESNPADPLAGIVKDLTGSDPKAMKAAREAVSGIAGGGRPWEQLPQRMRTAARFDAQALLAEGGGRQALLDAGYDGFTAGRLLQDLGQA